MAKPRGMGDRAGEMALDVAGTVDPTGIVDVTHAAKLASEGRYTDAAITAAGVIPVAGDALKTIKYARMAPGADGVVDKIDGKIAGGMAHAQEHGHGLIQPGGIAGWRATKAAKAEASGPAQTGPSRKFGGR